MAVVIVTGGTFGLGQSITVELARRGHQVVAFGLAQAQVSSTARGFDALREELAQIEIVGLSPRGALRIIRLEQVRLHFGKWGRDFDLVINHICHMPKMRK